MKKGSFSLRSPTASPGDPGGAVFRKEATQTLACTENGRSPPPLLRGCPENDRYMVNPDNVRE